LANAKLHFEKSLSEFRSPETKTLLSEVESLLREEQRKAYINPEIAEQEKEKGNEFFRKGKSLFRKEKVNSVNLLFVLLNFLT
jgi:hypothetical protein